VRATQWTADPSHGPLPLLLVCLTVVTGLVDAFSYLRLGHVFVANMTGNVVFLGFGLAGASCCATTTRPGHPTKRATCRPLPQGCLGFHAGESPSVTSPPRSSQSRSTRASTMSASLAQTRSIYLHERKFQHYVEDFCLLVLENAHPVWCSAQGRWTPSRIERTRHRTKSFAAARLSEAWARTAEGAGSD
jgi:hypothetical protein